MPYTFRPAVESDVQAIADIYNASVMAGGATADLSPAHRSTNAAPGLESHTPPYGAFCCGIGRRFNHWRSVRSPCSMTAQDMTVSPNLAYYIDPAWQGTGSRHVHA